MDSKNTNLMQKYSFQAMQEIEKILLRLESIYPEHKVFAFSALMEDSRAALAKIAKDCKVSGYEEILNDFGYQIISKEELKQIRPCVVYIPGKEPQCIAGRVQNALKLLGEYYPNKIIEGSVEKEHKSLAGKLAGLYQWLGYDSLRDFLNAYGYEYHVRECVKVEDYTGEVVEYLKEKYGQSKAKTIAQISEENPQIASRITLMSQKANNLFGMSIVQYFISIGILQDREQDEKEALARVVDLLVEMYPLGLPTLRLGDLYKKHPILEELGKKAERECERKYGKTLSQYLRDIGILKTESVMTDESFADFQFNKSQTHIEKYLGSATRVVIPEKINTIGANAFKESNVVEITLAPHSVLKSIDKSAFEGCASLKIVDLRNATPAQLKIGDKAFAGCRKLEQILGKWDFIKVKSGAFEGCINVFVRDGEYKYPRLWLYNWLVYSSVSGTFNLDAEEINGIDLSCVTLLNRYSKRQSEDFYYVPVTNIPVAADAGYGNVVSFAGVTRIREFNLKEVGLDKKSANSMEPMWKVFYMPTEETIKHFLAHCSIDAECEDFVEDEDAYITKQRKSFEEFNAYYADTRAELTRRSGVERIDFSFENPITQPTKKLARVVFIGHQGYEYRCGYDVEVGDVVYVDGSRAGDIGVVFELKDDWSEEPYYKDVIKAYKQFDRKIEFDEDADEIDFHEELVFKLACETKTLSQIFPKIPVISKFKMKGSEASYWDENWVQFVVDTELEKKQYFANNPSDINAQFDSNAWFLEEGNDGFYLRSTGNGHNVSSLIVPNLVTGIGEVTQYKDTLQTVRTNSVDVVSFSAFSGCTKLREVILNEDLIRIEGGAFLDCTALQEIILPDSVLQLEGEAFSNCQSLSKVVLSKRLTKIECYTFLDCVSLQKIIIPENVRSIESSAFRGCSSLECVILLNGDCKIASGKNLTEEEEVFGYSCPKIIAPAGGAVEQYAIDNDLEFVPLDFVRLNQALLFAGLQPIQPIRQEKVKDWWYDKKGNKKVYPTYNLESEEMIDLYDTKFPLECIFHSTERYDDVHEFAMNFGEADIDYSCWSLEYCGKELFLLYFRTGRLDIKVYEIDEVEILSVKSVETDNGFDVSVLIKVIKSRANIE